MALLRKVLLVDDHELVRVGVKATYGELLGIGIEWVEASTLADAVELYRLHADIDAVMLDLNLADCKGLQGLRLFLQAHPQARVAVFSGTQDEFVIRQARALGATAYVGKGAMTSETRETLLALLNVGVGGARPAPSAAGALFPRLPRTTMYDRVSVLGPRHLEILELVLSGCTNQEISHSTTLSLGTVKNYVSSLLLALDVRSRSHLISFADGLGRIGALDLELIGQRRRRRRCLGLERGVGAGEQHLQLLQPSDQAIDRRLAAFGRGDHRAQLAELVVDDAFDALARRTGGRRRGTQRITDHLLPAAQGLVDLATGTGHARLHREQGGVFGERSEHRRQR